MEIISRELLGAILNKEIIDQPITLKGSDLHYNGIEIINIFELVGLAKEWAFAQNLGDITTTLDRNGEWVCRIGTEVSAWADAEYKAVFKACQIILDREINQ